jgi:hypothetical protein
MKSHFFDLVDIESYFVKVRRLLVSFTSIINAVAPLHVGFGFSGVFSCLNPPVHCVQGAELRLVVLGLVRILPSDPKPLCVLKLTSERCQDP